MRQKVDYTINPFLFIHLKWTEDWAFSLTRGTLAQPEQITTFYQKSEGTSHIQHLCGAIVLQKKNDAHTDVFIYEEAKATGRSEGDTLRGVEATIVTLRRRG